LERDELLAQLEAAREEGGRLVFVGGEAGVGKTSLVRALAERLDGRVLLGSCENLTTPTPLGPFLDLGVPPGETRDVATAVLEELNRPALLVLEDLHWADQATLDVLRVLARRVDRTSSLVVGTYRADEIEGDHPLRVVLGELASTAAVSRLSVPPLSRDAVEVLAEPHGADGRAIYELTRGNAFYVTEILATGGDSLPPTVRDAVLARAASLDATARRLLDIAALVPARAEFWLLEAVAPTDLAGLDLCLAAGMLRVEGDAVSFRHELARLAIEDAIAPRSRREWHRAILGALAAPPHGEADPARLAHHADGAGDAEAVLEHGLIAARRAVAASAHREAFAQYERVLRHADRLEPAERARVLLAYAQQAGLTGRQDAAIVGYTTAVELFRSVGDRLGEGEALSRLNGPYIWLGRNADAERVSRASIDVLEPHGASRELALAYAMQAGLRMLNRDNYAGVEWGEKALALAESLGDADTQAWALNSIGTSYVMAGEIERGVAYIEQSIEVAREHDLAVRAGAGYSMLASGLGEMYDLERSEEFAHAFIAHADEHGADDAYIRSWLACVRVYRGDWESGTALARQVLSSHGVIPRITAFIALGRVRARRGDPGAMEALDEALELSLPGGHLQRLGHVYAARAEAAWLAGHRDGAIDEAHAVYDLALEKRHLWFAGELAYWQWKARVPNAAPEWIAEPYRLQIAGDARAAADAWRARGCPYEAGRALAEADEDDAIVEALDTFDQLGAAPAAKLARQLLRARGAAVPRGPRATTRANPADLTSRELEVLRLVAAGKRNADVAAELVLSRRTVDHHMSSILRKLDVKTRSEAAAAASRLGLLKDR
jgi:DNA-binding CsgD family transcriptional regulator